MKLRYKNFIATDTPFAALISIAAIAGLECGDQISMKGEPTTCLQMQKGKDVREGITNLWGFESKDFYSPGYTLTSSPSEDIRSLIEICAQKYDIIAPEACAANAFLGMCEGNDRGLCNSVREKVGNCF